MDTLRISCLVEKEFLKAAIGKQIAEQVVVVHANDPSAQEVGGPEDRSLGLP